MGNKLKWNTESHQKILAMFVAKVSGLDNEEMKDIEPGNWPKKLEHCTFRSLWHRVTRGYPRGVPVKIQYWWCSRIQRLLTRQMTHCNEDLQVKMCGHKGYTVWHAVTYYSFHDEMFFYFIFYFLLGGAGCKSRGQIWRNGEMTRIGVYDVRSTKNQ